jgi:hypothetical protein
MGEWRVETERSASCLPPSSEARIGAGEGGGAMEVEEELERLIAADDVSQAKVLRLTAADERLLEGMEDEIPPPQ